MRAAPRDAVARVAALRIAALIGASVVAAAPVAAEPALTPVTHAEWEEILAAHRGEVVVVDFWATWCLPCIERFPKMVELSHRYADDGVTFVAFSLDDRADAGAMQKAEEFVAEQGGSIEHYVTAEPIPDAFERLDLLGIPAVKVYDRDGSLAATLDLDDPGDQFTDEDVEAAVRRVLGGDG